MKSSVRREGDEVNDPKKNRLFSDDDDQEEDKMDIINFKSPKEEE